jgi:competence protein ComEA
MKRSRFPGFLFVVLGLTALFCVTAAHAARQKVDLNTASEKELEALKGVGPATAKKIIANRPYASVDDLSKAGLNGKKITELKPLVTVSAAPAATAAPAPAPVSPQGAAPAAAPTTAPAAATSAKPAKASKTETHAATPKLAPGERVNINTASKDKLEALPGIGPVKAQLIIDGRPYATPEDVMKVKGIKQGEFAKIKDLITVR